MRDSVQAGLYPETRIGVPALYLGGVPRKLPSGSQEVSREAIEANTRSVTTGTGGPGPETVWDTLSAVASKE